MDYFYEGMVEAVGTPFQVTPSECEIVYTCYEPIYGLCDLTTETTISLFDPETAGFSFSTIDFAKFGTQSIDILITGTAGSSS